MSTKSTLTYGENFHLYTEGFDEGGGVWLHIEQPHNLGAAGPSGIVAETTLRIPLAVWEHIRRHRPADYSLADLDDDSLRARAESQARENRASYLEQRAKAKAPPNHEKAFLALWRHHGHHRSLAWQTERNLEQLRERRAEQRALRAAVEAVARYSSPEAVAERRAKLPPIRLPKKRRLPRRSR